MAQRVLRYSGQQPWQWKYVLRKVLFRSFPRTRDWLMPHLFTSSCRGYGLPQRRAAWQWILQKFGCREISPCRGGFCCGPVKNSSMLWWRFSLIPFLPVLQSLSKAGLWTFCSLISTQSAQGMGNNFLSGMRTSDSCENRSKRGNKGIGVVLLGMIVWERFNIVFIFSKAELGEQNCSIN